MRFLFFITIWLSTLFSYSQEAPLNPVKFGPEQGLGTSQVLRIAEDRYRNLWLLTFYGTIIRFDGLSFAEFTLTEELFTNNLYQIAVSTDDKVFLLSDLGLIEFDGKRFQLVSGLKGLSLSYQSKLMIDPRNRLLIIDDNGKVATIVGGKIVCPPIENIVGMVSASGTTELWKSDGTIYSLDQNAQLKKEDAVQIKNALSLVIPCDSSSDLRYIFSEEEIVVWNKATSSIAGTIQSPIGHWKVSDAAFDRFGNLGVLADYQFHTLTPDGKWTRLPEDHASEATRILDLFVSKAGFLWLGTDGKGLMRVQKKIVERYDPPGDQFPWIIFDSPTGKTYVGTFGDGLFRFTNGAYIRSKKWKELNKAKVTSFAAFGGDIIITTFGDGIWKMDDHENITRIVSHKDHPSSRYSSFVFVKDKVTYIGTNAGLLQIENNRIKSFTKKEFETAMAYSFWRGHLLVGFFSGGVHLFSEGHFSEVSAPGLEKASVNYFMIDDANRLWVASNKPYLLVFDSLNAVPKRVHLPGIFPINLVEFVERNTLLAGTETSAYLISLDDSLKVKKTRKLDSGDGFIQATVSSAPALRKKGYLWFGTSQGLCKIPKEIDPEPSPELIVYLKSISISQQPELGKFASSFQGFYAIPTNLRIPHSMNEVNISFFAADFSRGSNVRYRYQLSPKDKRWRPATTLSEVNYTNLAPSKYTFIVQAERESGEWSASTFYSFEIVPAFWQTTAFKVIAPLALTLCLVATIRYVYSRRIEKFRRDENLRKETASKIREQISMDFHDELGNKLAAIVAHSSALKLKSLGKDPDFFSLLHFVEENAKQIYDGTRDFIWSIDVKSNNLKEVTFYVKDFGERLFAHSDISFFVTHNLVDTKGILNLSDGYGRHLLLFCKEALTNAFKHSGAKNVWLKVFHDNRDMYVSIEDDGKGLTQANPRGNGLRNMKRRAIKIGGQIHIGPRKPMGTIVELTFQL